MDDNPRQDLYLKISRNLENQELRDLRNYVSGAEILSAGFVQHADAHQICNQLEKEQKLKPGDLSLLVDLLRKIGRRDYAERAKKIAENERKDPLSSSRDHPQHSSRIVRSRSTTRESQGRTESSSSQCSTPVRDRRETTSPRRRHGSSSSSTSRRTTNQHNNSRHHHSCNTSTRGSPLHLRLPCKSKDDPRRHSRRRHNTSASSSSSPPRRRKTHSKSRRSRHQRRSSSNGGSRLPRRTQARPVHKQEHDRRPHRHTSSSSYSPRRRRSPATSASRSLQGSPQPSTSQLKRKREDGEEFPVKKKKAPREEGSPVGGDIYGVRKYFFYIKEKVSSDWKDLAFHLGLEQPDIDNIKGRNRDHDKSRCMDLLEEWLKRNGEKATIEVLMEALSEANLQSVVDGLRKQFPEVPIPVPVTRTESSSLTGGNQNVFEMLKHLLTEVRVEDGSQADTYNRLARHVAESGLTFRDEVPKDGNCMFHAVADQLLRTEGWRINHMELRNRAVNFLRGHPYNDNGDHLSAFVPDQNWEAYLSTMSRDGTWGDHIVLQAMADLFGHDVSIVSSVEAENYVTILTPSTGTVGRREPPLLLGHYAENHYASLDEQKSQVKNPVLPVRLNLSLLQQSPIPERVSSRILDLEQQLITVEVLMDPERLSKAREVLREQMAFLMELLGGSVILLLGFLCQRDLDGFYHNHDKVGEGSLSHKLSSILIPSNIQDEFEGTQLIVKLHVKYEDYVRVREKLGVSVPAGAVGTESSSLTDVFQKTVKKYYELKLSHFKPLIWNDSFTLNIRDIFTHLVLVPTSEKQNKTLGDQREGLKSLDDLFNPHVTGLSIAPRCILIEGEAGGGKTMFLFKEALDAVSQKTEVGKQHDIVLLIRLREVREGETIEEMVWDQCVPEIAEGIDLQSIGRILQWNASRLLFLLDGYDELRPEARAAGQAIPKLLSGKLFPNSTIVITSRPSAGVQWHTRPDCHVHIMGFSESHAEKYMEQYFTAVRNEELTETLIEHVEDNEHLDTLMYTPMLLMLLCVLWEEDQEMVSTGTMTGLYDNLLTCLVRKYCEREGVDITTEGLPTEVAESLLQLGKLALEALLRNETLIDLTEVEREKVNWELLLKLGVVSLEVSSSKLHPRKQLNFSHKTMQEFLAGRYVAHALLNQDIVELLQLTSITKALELSNLLQFTCGCDSRAAQAVMEELSNLSKKEFSKLQPNYFQKSQMHLPVKLEKKKLVEIYRRFTLLCLDILNERSEPGVLQAVSRALPVIIMDLDRHRKQHAALKYYLQTIQSSALADRMILESFNGDSSKTLQYLEQVFTSPISGLQLDLRLYHLKFDSHNDTARLVSVLKNVPGLRVLDLSHTQLTPSSLQPLVQGFNHMSLLEELDLFANTDLGDAGMEVLQVGLLSVPHLAVLCVSAVGMTGVGMSSLASYLCHLQGLRELNISFNMIGHTGLESLTTILSTSSAMQVLVLFSIGISPTGMRTLVPALCQLTRLIKLDITLNAIGDPGLECLADILPHLTAMKVLLLRQTGIGNSGISSLIKALPQLQVLDVRDNNIGDSGIVSLVQTLCQPSSLDMDQKPSDKSLTTAPQCTCNTTLEELYIGNNSAVTGAGQGRVAQLISALPALTRLDLSGCRYTPAHLSDTAATALAEALPRLPALERLDLQHVPMEPAGFQAVVQAAEEHPTLERLIYNKSLVPEGEDTASCLELA